MWLDEYFARLYFEVKIKTVAFQFLLIRKLGNHQNDHFQLDSLIYNSITGSLNASIIDFKQYYITYGFKSKKEGQVRVLFL